MTKARIVFSALVLALCGSAAQAQSVPPLPNLDNLPYDKKQPVVSGMRLGNLALGMERTTLAELTGRIKLGTVTHRGDAGSSEYAICFAVAAPTPARIWLTSGEMGGPAHSLGGIHIAAGPPVRRCRRPLRPWRWPTRCGLGPMRPG